MGRPEIDKPNSNQYSILQHFSHPHPLEFSNLQLHHPTLILPPCAICKQQTSGSIYICKTCNFILHISCSQKPQLINHPADPNHPLTLLPFPAYPDGTFTCDACGVRDNGFCYHCRACTLDLHINCASMPMSLNHQAHPHTLSLSNRRRSLFLTCDMCSKEVGANQWSYGCLPCDFDAHLSCASDPNAKPNRSNIGFEAAVQGFPQGFTTAGGGGGGSSSIGGGTSSTVDHINYSIAMQSLKNIQEMAFNASEGAKYGGGGGTWSWKKK
ncbi:uncharacterized protein LOC122078308 [Macadamia integrifolia]|uniref:uncharacterized protein LOC122078308 n=1 Tax=Macadamia integrifolia TaxID=60698 RepID=UPI001C4FCAA8|nr:uncharacterized protein LOC122078308 [Macadamia integrifolia]